MTVKVEFLQQQKRLQTISFTVEDADLLGGGGVGGGCVHSYHRLAVVVMEENQRTQRAGSQGESVQKKPFKSSIRSLF